MLLRRRKPWARALFDAVGPDREDAVYRALAAVLHGDVDLMADLVTARKEGS